MQSAEADPVIPALAIEEGPVHVDRHQAGRPCHAGARINHASILAVSRSRVTPAEHEAADLDRMRSRSASDARGNPFDFAADIAGFL